MGIILFVMTQFFYVLTLFACNRFISIIIIITFFFMAKACTIPQLLLFLRKYLPLLSLRYTVSVVSMTKLNRLLLSLSLIDSSTRTFSAGLVVKVVDPKPGESIVDCCAAPGGKTLFMASLLNGQGTLFQIVVSGLSIEVC